MGLPSRPRKLQVTDAHPLCLAVKGVQASGTWPRPHLEVVELGLSLGPGDSTPVIFHPTLGSASHQLVRDCSRPCV